MSEDGQQGTLPEPTIGEAAKVTPKYVPPTRDEVVALMREIVAMGDRGYYVNRLDEQSVALQELQIGLLLDIRDLLMALVLAEGKEK